MKKLILLFLLVTLAAPTLFSQNRAVRDFIREHRKGEENVAITIPGFLIGLAGEIGMLASEDEEERAAFSLAQEFGTTRILTFDNHDFDAGKDIKRLLRTLESEHNYERWATVRAKSGEQVELSVSMKGDTVREIIAIVSEPTEHRTVFLHAKTDFTAEELGEVLNKLVQ
ncbi:DUF4252 domain-containing protein [Neolewinella persica]|uniref:DUF4252 domain-containing protein n=1 Tax=Neolewinella persica TaxID=70998 RepID=UPI000376F18E|nr:DUF4252 domain-containing protein [Neolewinella persica]